MMQYFNSWADIARALTALLALAAALLILFGSASPRRMASSTKWMTSSMTAVVFLWQVYTSVEVIIATPDAFNEVPGIRVYGFVITYGLLIVALLVDGRRAREVKRAAAGKPVVVVPVALPVEPPKNDPEE